MPSEIPRPVVDSRISLVAQKKLNDARAAAEHAAALAHQGSDRIIRMTAGFAQADVDTRTGKAAGAERDLSALYDQANRNGYAVFELEARLLLAQAEFASGKPAAARAHLEKLQWDARNKAFSSSLGKPEKRGPVNVRKPVRDD